MTNVRPGLSAGLTRAGGHGILKALQAILNVLTMGIVVRRMPVARVPTSLSGGAGALLLKFASILVEEVASVDCAGCVS